MLRGAMVVTRSKTPKKELLKLASLPDDKIRAGRGDNAFESPAGSSFGGYQLACYVASTLGMAVYCVHWLAGRDLHARLVCQAAAEVVILLLRWANEYAHGKYEAGDIVHHLTFVVGALLAVYLRSFRPYAFLLCHMQILHPPLVLWYLGCRQNCYSTSRGVMHVCSALFPSLMTAATAYRCTIMLRCVYAAATQRTQPVVAAVLAFFTVVLMWLDYRWNLYFNATLNEMAAKNRLRISRVVLNPPYLLLPAAAGIVCGAHI